MKFLFDWHSQDSRATGPLDVANTVTAQYGTGGAMRRWWYMSAVALLAISATEKQTKTAAE